MTDTEKAVLERRIDELCAEVERGTAEFKKMDAWHSQELKAAMDENAKLLEDLEFERSENGWAREFLNRMGRKCGTKDCPSLVAYVTKLETENAKLRELMSVMAYCNQFRRDCDGCAMNGAAGIVTERAGCDELLASLRELGIEVPS